MEKLLKLIAISLLAISFGFCSTNQPKPQQAPQPEEVTTAKKPTVEDLKRLRSRDLK